MLKKLPFLLILVSYTLFSQTGLNFTASSPSTFVKGVESTSLELSQGTIEAWIKTADAGTTYRGIIVKQAAYGMFLYNNELIAYDWGSNTEKKSNVTLNDDLWHHVAITFDDNINNGSQFYVDGQPVLSFTYNVQTSNTLIVVGKGNDTEADIGQQFNGQIDNVRVWNTIRTDAEILGAYNKCLTGNENGLVLNWKFEEGSGTSTADDSGNGNTGTLYNMDNTNWVSGYSCYPIELAAYYPFNGNANDESGNDNNGTVNGATLTTDRFGNTDSAYSFDGNDIITIPHSEVLNSENELSISVWVKPNIQQDAMILGKSNYTSATNYLLRTKSSGFIQFEYKDFANSNSIPLLAGTWNHIAAVSQDDNSKQIYINGVLASHTTANSPYGIVPNDLTIGYASYGSEHFNGSIDDLRIYKSALSESDILSLFTNNALNIEKLTETTESNFYISNNTLYFKNTQNLNKIKSVEVYNLLGQQVFRTSKIEEQILLNNLTNGVFIAKVNSENGFETLKFLKN